MNFCNKAYKIGLFYAIHITQILTEYVVLYYNYMYTKFDDSRIETITFMRFLNFGGKYFRSYRTHIAHFRSRTLLFTRTNCTKFGVNRIDYATYSEYIVTRFVKKWQPKFVIFAYSGVEKNQK